MAGEPVVTLIGNLAADPEMRFLPSGIGVCNFTLAATPRVKQGDNWADGETLWVRCAVWRQPAENAVESLVKGTRVIVHGRLKVRTFETNGEKRTSIEMDVDELGPSLKYATTKVNRVTREHAAGTAGGSDDPWGKTPDTPGKPVVDDEPAPF